jgi:hypothetical protein
VVAPSSERPSSAYAVLDAMVSDGKQCGGGGRSHLGFNGREEAVARSLDGELLPLRLGVGSGFLRWASIQGEGWGNTRRIQQYSLSGRQYSSGFESAWQRRAVWHGGGRWGKSVHEGTREGVAWEERKKGQMGGF